MIRIAKNTFNAVVDISDASYTLTLVDGLNRYLRFTNASATIIIPFESSVNFPVGSQIFIREIGAGLTIECEGSGIELNGVDDASIDGSGAYAVIILTKVGSDDWEASGDYS